MRPYIVRQGDYLTQLAHRRGFSVENVWSHPSNDALRQKRTSPDVLQPGDILYLPEAHDGRNPLPLTIGGENVFSARVHAIEIKLVLKRADGTAIANKPFRVDGMGPQPFESTTDGTGLAFFSVPVHVCEVTLSLHEERLYYRLRVGHMDPASESSGIAKRLAHLGYLPVIDFGAFAPCASMLRDAIAAFQEAHGELTVSGTPDDATRDALVAAHGS